MKIFREYGFAILAAAALALGIRFWVAEVYRIPTPVMRPTLEPGDLIIAWKWGYGSSTSQVFHGDVVIYSYKDQPNFIKRIIAKDGDRIQVRAGNLVLNDQELRFKPTDRLCGIELHPIREYAICREAPPLPDFGPEMIPAGHVFVLGDLHTRSSSTHPFQIVPLTAIKAKVRWIWVSFDQTEPSSGWMPRFRFDRMFRTVE